MKIDEVVKGAKIVGITGHIHPDGDCVGSVLALYLYLKKNMPDLEVEVFLEEPSEAFKCIKGFDMINTSFKSKNTHDVFFCLDCTFDRCGDAEKLLKKASKVVNIDHHITNSGMGDEWIVEPQRSSCAELLYELLDKNKIDEDIALAIYIGIIHDSGVFQYSNTSPRTFEIAAELIKFGFDFPKIIEDTFYIKSYTHSQLLGRALLESVRFMDGKCIVSVIGHKTMQFYNATPKNLDGVVNQLRNVRGVDVSILMYEIAPLRYKVSLRSNGAIDVAVISARFGGGGHVRAAGFTFEGTSHDAINNISEQIELQYLAKSVCGNKVCTTE